MAQASKGALTDIVGKIPYRMALAGGWIDQPFISRMNPDRIGSMVVVGIEPTFRWMDRCGIATGTRKVAQRLWPDGFPRRDYAKLVRELYTEENKHLDQPSGSQDMIGLIYPGVNRLDFDARHEDGIFPAHIESNNDPGVARWIENVFHVIPVAPRPAGYNPLGEQWLDAETVRELGQTGKDCFSAILDTDLRALGASMNRCMKCWEALLPNTVRHPTISVDLVGLLNHYQQRYAGAMFSGCGGGYLYVVSEKPVPGAFQVKVRIDSGAAQ